MATAGDRFHEALALHQSGRGDEAEPVYRELLRNDPAHAGAWHLLGLVLHERGDLPRALEHIQKALAICGHKAVYWNNLGAVHKDLRRFREARAAFERAIALRDTYADAWSNLGLMQVELGQLEEAERSLRYAIRLQPRHADALRHMAVVYREKGEFEEALRFCRDAAAVAPDDGEVFEIEGGVLAALKRCEEALSAYAKAIARNPNAAHLYLNQGSVYTDLGETEKARESFGRAARLRPDRAIWRIRRLGLCPTIFQTEEEITEYRAELERRLDEALADPPAFDWRYALRDGFTPSFQLAFHGVCNRRIKEKFARLFAPSFPLERPEPRNRSKIRVGFLCTRTHEAGFVRGFGGIMRGLDRRRFEVVGLVSDDVRSTCRKNVHGDEIHWVGFPFHLERAWKAIRATECDLVVHWHAGSDVLNYFLPFLPLAPYQCIGFGANGTTGISNIDHFVSSRLFERGEGAEDDYTEQLVQFDGLTTWQARPPVARGTARSDFGLPASGPLYFCPQQIGKFHPRFDFLLRRILEEVPAGHIVVLSGRRPCAAEALRARLERTLGAKLSKQVVFFPSQPATKYYRLLDLADVVLDSPVFSTSLTGFDALSAGKPIVTIPGEQMAERYALGLYRLMGVGDLIAASATEYVALAVRLGRESDFRESIGERIRKRCSRLYENRSAVREYEDFFGRVVRQGQAVRPAG